jgi:hypothetical protein
MFIGACYDINEMPINVELHQRSKLVLSIQSYERLRLYGYLQLVVVCVENDI